MKSQPEAPVHARRRCSFRWDCRRSTPFRASHGRRSRCAVSRQLDFEQLAFPGHRDPMGYAPLRRAIASYLRIARDISCSAEQILITAGFQGALGLIVQALLEPDDKVWVEDPGYFQAHGCCARRRCGSSASGSMSEGLDVGAGTRMAPGRGACGGHADPSIPARHDLAGRSQAGVARLGRPAARLDRRGRLRLRSSTTAALPPPALKSLDRSGRVLYVGSFSKVLFPGPAARLCRRARCLVRALRPRRAEPRSRLPP